MRTRREFVTATVGVGVTAAAGLSAMAGAITGGRGAQAGSMEIVVTLNVVDGELKQKCDDMTRQAMLARKAAIVGYDQDRRQRTAFGALASAAAHENDPDHVTIVFSESGNDAIEWRCANPFVVTVERDPNCTAIEGTPANPFGWAIPQTSQETGAFHSVRAVPIKGSGASRHKFYKFTVWSEGLKLDPDMYCGA